MKKHILFILPYLNQGGTEKQAFSLIEGLRDHYKISLLAPDGKGAPQFRALPISQREFTRWDFNFFKGLPELIAGIREIQREQAIDIVHVHGAHELMLPVRLVLGKVPIIFTVHGYHGDSAQFSYQMSCWFSNLLANQVISVCEAEYNLLKELGLNTQKLHLIYNGVKEPVINADKSLELAKKFNLDPANQLILGTAARLNEAKGLTYLLKAFAALAPSPSPIGRGGKDLRLVIAGTGDLEASLKQEAQDLDIGDRVIFTGYLDDLPNLMQLFDIFVLPSLQEPFGLVCAEAMSQSKPVVVTKVGGLVEQVIDRQTGFIVMPRDPDSLAKSLAELIADQELRDRFSKNGYTRYRQMFSSEIMLKKTANLCDTTV
ncbi:MAG TPA: glycosyltransferase family 1 protein [Pseudanabaena sp.]|nr:glycosyltransferase family 1 protein [Pseudanabaena sp.]